MLRVSINSRKTSEKITLFSLSWIDIFFLSWIEIQIIIGSVVNVFTQKRIIICMASLSFASHLFPARKKREFCVRNIIQFESFTFRRAKHVRICYSFDQIICSNWIEWDDHGFESACLSVSLPTHHIELNLGVFGAQGIFDLSVARFVRQRWQHAYFRGLNRPVTMAHVQLSSRRH